MYLSEIKKIFKDVMYLNDSAELDINKSLFLHYDMTSIDFIDFSFELKKAFGINIEPDELWPVNKMATREDYYSFQDKKWTPTGLKNLNQMLQFSNKEPVADSAIEFKELYNYFTLSYVNSKLIAFTTVDN